MKNDDYLWNGSGEVDEEIERLEQTLASLRFKAQPLPLPAAPTRRVNIRFLAAAAAVVMALAGLWIYLGSRAPRSAPQIASQPPLPVEPQSQKGASDQATVQSNGEKERRAFVAKPRRKASPRIVESSEALTAAAPASPLEIGRHIESAQLLLRAVKNISEDEPAVDVSYERGRSRLLLQQNILLRRNAEARGNLPISETLGALEPFLLDIANLREKPSRGEMSVIKQRIEKKEIIATLQVYSTVSILN